MFLLTCPYQGLVNRMIYAHGAGDSISLEVYVCYFIFLALPSGIAVSMASGRKEVVCAIPENEEITDDNRGMRHRVGDAGKL